jgi:hypothetical protein
MRQGFSKFNNYENRDKDVQYVIKLAAENRFDSLEKELKSESNQS